jgi:hypothetical protein
MEWIYKINGTRVEVPVNYEELSVLIERDFNRKGIFYKVGSSLTFSKRTQDYPSGYDVLEAANTDFCQSATITIEYRTTPTASVVSAFTGTIYMTDLQWGDGTTGDDSIVIAVIQDNSWQAMIRNNANIKASATAIKSKFGNALTPATMELVDFFTPSTGVYDILDVNCWSVYEMFRYLVAFMTDNQMGFQSTLFTQPSQFWGSLYITTGQNIRAQNGFATATTSRPVVSFGDLFTELDKIINLGISIDPNGDLRIERYSDIFGTGTVVSLSDVKTLTRKADTDRLFAKVIMGSEPQRWHSDGGVTFPDVKYFTHKAFFKDGTPEEYYTEGECNFDTALDLKGEWGRDTDVIEDIIVNDTDEYDGEIIIVQTDVLLPGQAKLFQLPSGDAYYNGDLLNSEIAPRMEGLLNLPIAFYDGGADNSFEAQKIFTEDSALLPNPTVELEFQDEISDPGGNYDDTGSLSRFIAPTDGYYRFGTQIAIDNIQTTGFPLVSIVIDITIQQRDSGGILIAEHTQQFSHVQNFSPVRFTFEPQGFYMAATDYAVVKVAWAVGPPASGVTFDIIGTDTYPAPTCLFYSIQGLGQGGTFQTFTSTRPQLIEAEVPLSLSDFELIKATPTDKVGLNQYLGNIERLEYFYATQMADIQITA